MMTEKELSSIVAGFWDHTLPAEEWTHMAHLIVGLHTACHYELETSIEKLREGIQTYNVANGTQNTDSSGYHETITVFFAHAMRAFNQRFEPDADFAQKVERLQSSVLIKPAFMFSFYSKDYLFTVEARRGLVPPDLRPLSDLVDEPFFK